MIKKTICILLLLGAVTATVFAVLNRDNTHTLLPLPKPKRVVEQAEHPSIPEPDSLTVQRDTVVINQ